jgi:tetratricopeptide (TPR) repeat protein
MRPLLVLTLILVGGVATAGAPPPLDRQPAQDGASLEALVREYRSGVREKAVAAASLWSDERIARETGRLRVEVASRDEKDERTPVLLPSLDVAELHRLLSEPGSSLEVPGSGENAEEREMRRLAAAAILTEAALSHLRIGDLRLLAPGLWTTSLLLDVQPQGPTGRAFAQEFYLLAGLILHWHVELEAGDRLLTKALRSYPENPELHTALGSLIETVASLRTYPPPPGSPESRAPEPGGYSSERGDYGGVLQGATLEQAEGHYARALAVDPTLDEARLRLAHVRLQEGRPEEALRDLAQVATQARQPRQRYLAWLFAGRAREMTGDLPGAVAAYRACVANRPRAQTGLLALARALDQAGDQPGAQQTLASVTAPRAPFDPWWNYQAGQPERVQDLVAQLRRILE